MKTNRPALRFTVIPALVLAGSLLAATPASAQEQTDSATGLTYTLANNEATVTGITSDRLPADGKLVIPETLGGKPVTKIGEDAFKGDPALKEFSASSVKRVGAYAFYDCDALTSFSLPVATTIGSYAFSYCDALTRVALPKLVSTEFAAFSPCTSLISISMPEATSIGIYTFWGCTSLTSVSLPEATSIGNSVFQGCTTLPTISLPKAHTIGNDSFQGCTALQTVDLPKTHTIRDRSFQSCTSLQTVNLPKAHAIGDGSFQGCTTLPTISLPKATYLDVNTFAGCTRLKTAFLPALANFTNNNAARLSRYFHNCTALKHVYIGGAPELPYADAFTGTHADLTIHHHPEYETHFASGNWQPLTKNKVVRPFSEPVDIAPGSGTATLSIRHAASSGSNDDWTYTVEQSTDLAAWAEAAPTASDSNTADSVVTKSRTIPANAAAAFYRVQAKPNFFGTD